MNEYSRGNSAGTDSAAVFQLQLLLRRYLYLQSDTSIPSKFTLMNRYLALLLILVLFIRCSQPSGKQQTILSANNLASHFFNLLPDKAYTLRTPAGVVLKIAANSFKTSANESVRLEIKEAISMRDIVRAGLTTSSNGRLLRSGGMIYINATVEGKPAAFLRPVKVSIPTTAYDSSMQVFRGESNADGSINWVDPSPLDSTPLSKHLNAGGRLFHAFCASCHKPGQDFTGPALAYCRQRAPSPDWPLRFTRYSPMMVQTDPYAIKLKREFNNQAMPRFTLTDAEVTGILDYCDNMAALYNPGTNPAPAADSLSAPYPCGMDTIYLDKEDTVGLPDTKADTGLIEIVDTLALSRSQAAFKTMFDNMPTYEFSIDYSGWYNVDCFVNNNLAAVTNVSLKARVLSALPGMDIAVYLCIPQRKLFVNGSKTADGSYFFYMNDQIPLILGDQATVLAIGTLKDSIYFGSTLFTVRQQQEPVVELKKAAPATIQKLLSNYDLAAEITDKNDFLKGLNDTSAIEAADSSAIINNTGRPYRLFPRPCGGGTK